MSSNPFYGARLISSTKHEVKNFTSSSKNLFSFGDKSTNKPIKNQQSKTKVEVVKANDISDMINFNLGK